MLGISRQLLLCCVVLILSGLSTGHAFSMDGGPGPGNRDGHGSDGPPDGGPPGGGGPGGGPHGGPGSGAGAPNSAPGSGNGTSFGGNQTPNNQTPNNGQGNGFGSSFNHNDRGSPPNGDHNFLGDHGMFGFHSHLGDHSSSPSAPVGDGNNGVGDDVANKAFGKRTKPGSSSTQFAKAPVLDQEQSKLAIQNGNAASMPLLLTYLDQKYPGQVLDVKLHTTSDGLVYEVRYLANVIELRTLFLDATTLNRK